MKLSLPLAVLTLGSFLSNAQALEVNFDDATAGTGDLDSHFQQNAAGTGGKFTPDAGKGIDASGSVRTSVGDGTTAILKSQTVNLSDGKTVNLSLRFLAGYVPTSGSDKIALQLGLVPSSDGDLRAASDYVCVRVGVNASNASHLILISRAEGSPKAQPMSEAFQLEKGHWYQLNASFTSDGATGLAVTGELLDLGPGGTDTPMKVSAFNSTKVVNAALASAISAHPAFRGSLEAGPTQYDDFSLKVD